MIVSNRKRSIKSFVLRSGRMTKAQSQAYRNLWDDYGLVIGNQPIDIERAFGRKASLVFEIGFGMGDSLLQQAINESERNFIGVEVYKPGVGRLMNETKKAGISNLRVVCQDAIDFLLQGLDSESIHGVQIYFPDPWHKLRHHKRRLIQPQFLDLLANRVEVGGFCHCVTDWAPYAEWMLEAFSQCAKWQNTSNYGDYIPRPDRRPTTKFEIRGKKIGYEVFDLIFRRCLSDQHFQ